ncbi:hypothetical protein MKW98_030675 [Papaver atlanticum]|uniref:Uncharacterized protein n=1 Tax=Papaver atlanticum TaxID=357466 RepID=A0AAD4X3E4_9MAGN|nr:hypothetical protein MKW98_030675 [Papaver atlanticum]
MHTTTRLLGKRKATEAITEQLYVEDHLIEAPEELNSSGNGKSLTSISMKLPLINCGNSGKQLVPVSTMLPTNNNEDLGVEPASTSTLVPVNNSENLVYMICYRNGPWQESGNELKQCWTRPELGYVTWKYAGRVLIFYNSLFGLMRPLGISDEGRVCCRQAK